MNYIEENMGSIDRSIRVMLTLSLIAMFFTGMLSGTIGVVLLVLSGVFLLTSLIGICPLYIPFGIRTCKKK